MSTRHVRRLFRSSPRTHLPDPVAAPVPRDEGSGRHRQAGDAAVLRPYLHRARDPSPRPRGELRLVQQMLEKGSFLVPAASGIASPRPYAGVSAMTACGCRVITHQPLAAGRHAPASSSMDRRSDGQHLARDAGTLLAGKDRFGHLRREKSESDDAGEISSADPLALGEARAAAGCRSAR